MKVLEDPDVVVVQVKLPHGSAGADRRCCPDRSGRAAEPEVITKKKEKPDEEEE